MLQFCRADKLLLEQAKSEGLSYRSIPRHGHWEGLGLTCQVDGSQGPKNETASKAEMVPLRLQAWMLAARWKPSILAGLLRPHAGRSSMRH